MIEQIDHDLMRLWEYHAKELFDRNGTDPKFPHGGHDIVNNPALAATLREVGMSYLPHCMTKFALIAEKDILEKQMLKGDEVREAFDRLGTALEKVQAVRGFCLQCLPPEDVSDEFVRLMIESYEA